MQNGFALITEERRATGIFGENSILFNATIANLDTYGSPLLREEEMRADTHQVIESTHVKTPGQMARIKNLSGGNQQKVILGRWLLTQPDVLLLDEPTRGIDVGAKYEIYQLILDLAAQGKGVMMVSSEMPELLGICDRILVMSNSRLAGIVERGKDFGGIPGENEMTMSLLGIESKEQLSALASNETLLSMYRAHLNELLTNRHMTSAVVVQFLGLILLVAALSFFSIQAMDIRPRRKPRSLRAQEHKLLSFLLDNALFLIMGLILVIVSILKNDFLSADNILNILQNASTKGILALGCAAVRSKEGAAAAEASTPAEAAEVPETASME